jgi:hypothetical protein
MKMYLVLSLAAMSVLGAASPMQGFTTTTCTSGTVGAACTGSDGLPGVCEMVSCHIFGHPTLMCPVCVSEGTE